MLYLGVKNALKYNKNDRLICDKYCKILIVESQWWACG